MSESSAHAAWSRPLGLGESFYWQADRLVRINFVCYAQVEGRLEPAALALALAWMQRAHPLLSARIMADPAGRLHFEAVEEAPAELVQVAPQALAEHWLKEIERPFDEGGAPLFRAHWAVDGPHAWVGLTLHHSIADGRSGAGLLAELLQRLAGAGKAAAVPPPPPLESAYRAEDFGAEDKQAHLLAVVSDLKRRALTLPRQAPAAGICETLPQGRYLTHRQWRMSEAQTQGLARLSRERGCTVHGALGAAYFRALHAQFLAPEQEWAFSLNTPVDLRPRTPALPARAAAMYVGAVNTLLPVSGARAFWELARALTVDLREQVRAGHAHLLYDLVFAKSPPSADPAAALALQERILRGGWNAMLTNIGPQAPLELGTALALRRLAFITSPLANQLMAFAVSSYRDMEVNAVYDAKSLPAAHAEPILDRFWSELQGALKAEPA